MGALITELQPEDESQGVLDGYTTSNHVRGGHLDLLVEGLLVTCMANKQFTAIMPTKPA